MTSKIIKTVLFTVLITMMLTGTTSVYAAQVTIHLEINADKTVTPTPNPTPVADGDTVKWVIDKNALAGECDQPFPVDGELSITLPAGGPFGSTPILELAPGTIGSSLEVSTPIDWPEGMHEYEYDIEFNCSPGIVTTLVLTEAHPSNSVNPIVDLSVFTIICCIITLILLITIIILLVHLIRKHK